MPTEDAYSSGHLVLSHFGTCMCSYVETNLSWVVLSPDFWILNIPRYFSFASYIAQLTDVDKSTSNVHVTQSIKIRFVTYKCYQEAKLQMLSRSEVKSVIIVSMDHVEQSVLSE